MQPSLDGVQWNMSHLVPFFFNIVLRLSVFYEHPNYRAIFIRVLSELVFFSDDVLFCFADFNNGLLVF